MTADDSMKCWCANSGMTGQVGGFQNPGVCLQAFPSFLPHPLPALLLAPFFARSLTLVPRSLLLNRTETLATQASGSHAWHACVELKNFDNVYCKQQNFPCLRDYELFNWTTVLRMKNNCRESVGFSFRAALWFRQWFSGAPSDCFL